ncbi:GNAT family N-acetyltransferase [Flavobacteriaceae bacterium S356]|uniref:GNAT family N-acetyltransferase n=1 Tax=Asprobacillus argus TaxID=3076534 RepID=A0ABU3LG14_9FLAO|nr:GNAT family N-acetyltransferase [Flavobacteriaceae bacterium S356]
MDYTIRLAVKEDMVDVHRLITELAVFEKEPDAVEVSVEDLKESGFSEKPAFKVYVAENENVIVGMALFYERYSTWVGRIIHLEDLIVTKASRGTGVGKALYTTLLEYANRLGVKRVTWEVLDWNKNAVDFYESTGATILKEWRVVHMKEKGLKKFIKN